MHCGISILVFHAFCLGGLNKACFVMLSTHHYLSSATKVKVSLVVGNAISEYRGAFGTFSMNQPQIFYVDELDFILQNYCFELLVNIP